MIFPKPEIFSFKTSNIKNAKFSILIPSWNNLEMLKLCLQAVLKNSSFKHQIIVHVNEGADGTLEWIKSQGHDFTYSQTNAGVCYAVNAMAQLAETDYLLYLNDDMYVCPQWDKYLMDEVDKQANNLWYLSGTMIEPKGNNMCAITPFDFGTDPHHFDENGLLKFASETKKQDWFGACWPPSLVHKELFERVGGYSEEFSPGMYSDPDFAIKLWVAGVRHFKGVGQSLVYHFQSRSTARVQKNNGRKQFAVKWRIPSSYFYKKVLLLGKPFDSNTKLKLKFNGSYLIALIRAFYIARF